MLTAISVKFMENKYGNEYTYLTTDPVKIGDVFVVNSPRNGYVTVEVRRVLKDIPARATAYTVQKVDDTKYKQREDNAKRLKKITEAIAKREEEAKVRITERVLERELLCDEEYQNLKRQYAVIAGNGFDGG